MQYLLLLKGFLFSAISRYKSCSITSEVGMRTRTFSFPSTMNSITSHVHGLSPDALLPSWPHTLLDMFQGIMPRAKQFLDTNVFWVAS